MSQKTKDVLSVDIGIPALNEELNIRRILQAVGKQRQDSFRIKNIIVISDGSTDRTVEYAKSHKLPNLKVLENETRKGLPTNWYKLCQSATADVLILLDADIILGDDRILDNLIKPIIENPKVTMTSGHSLQLTTNSFTDKVMSTSIFLQDYVKTHFHGGQSVYSCVGRIVAVRHSIASQVPPPKHRLGNDAFLYFFNKTHGGEFLYTPNAAVTCKLPQAFEDFSKQAKRFMNSKDDLAKIFGDWIYDEYRLPKSLIIRALLAAFLKHPIYTTAYVMFQLRFRLFSDKRTINAKDWQTTSTKKLD